MSILVSREGILTTVQDLGRFRYQRFGVNPGGVMDRTAARLLNTLLGNDDGSAVLETHYPAGEYLFEKKTFFAVGGADFHPHLSGKLIRNWTVHRAKKGDVLGFRQKLTGERAYLAVVGGFSVPSWLESSATNLTAGIGGFEGRRLRTGDRISYPDGPGSVSLLTIGRSIIPKYGRDVVVRIAPGPEFDRLTALSQTVLTGSRFLVRGESNRMGFRLDGPRLYGLSEAELLSSGVTFGTIQLLPDGNLIVLMADHQTTGGYPRIATVAAVDLPLMAQLGAGGSVSLRLIDHIEAENAILDLECQISFLRTALGLRAQ